MTTVGYGDIVPISPNEKIFAIAAMLVACAMFGYMIGSIEAVMEKTS
jgi:hyperpolarization activated cyclic nucleotide-gated potassium channel 2